MPDASPPVGMVEAVARKDWSLTPLGPAAQWPASLSAAAGICLHSHFPMLVLWGPELTLLYNDAYSPILGDKHPGALGLPVSLVWEEIWPTIGPMLHGVLRSGVATRGTDLQLVLQRRGFLEECYFTFSYSPIRADDGSIGGVFIAVLETTERVVGERRLKTLSEVGARLPSARDKSHALELVRDLLAGDLHSFPFAALYLVDATGARLARAVCTGLHDAGPEAAPSVLELADEAHPVVRAARTGMAGEAPLHALLPDGVRCGVWPEPPQRMRLLPLHLPGQAAPCGVFVAAADPRRPWDADYRTFLDLVAGQVTRAMANAEAIEMERRRTQAMAQLDKAKSEFFSNVSHELRTPVTLILGPLEEVLQEADAGLSRPLRDRLAVVHRNASRLKGLVDIVLDFSRIEAGRLLVRTEPTDVVSFTHEIVSLIRSAIEARGLRLSVQAQLPVPVVLLDRDMWEKVLLNLLTNALKCTFEGDIAVELGVRANSLTLAVRDTGCGIDADELPQLFDRFHRTRRSSRLAIEGTGIGLALVRELVRLHGGRIEVDSTPGVGSTFRVSIPFRVPDGEALAAQRETARSLNAQRLPFLPEPITTRAATPAAAPGPGRPAAGTDGARVKVLVADDNPDLTRYIARLLADRCEVVTVHDGQEALAAARSLRPDLLLADVMMPGMDGFELLKSIRADESTATMSVIMLSARAGEEARLQALQAGADDYVVKPFNARELIARVQSLVQSQTLLRDAHAQLERAVVQRTRELSAAHELLAAVFDRAPSGIAITDMTGRFLRANTAYQRLLGRSEAVLQTLTMKDITDADDYQRKQAWMSRLVRGELDSFAMEVRYTLPDGNKVWVSNFVSTIRKDGQPIYFVKISQDISARKNAERATLASQAKLRRLYDRLQSVREEERLALAREVHDHLGQLLSAAKIDIKLLEDDLKASVRPPSRRKLMTELRSARQTVDHAIESVRQVAGELRPPKLDEHGLCAAIEWHARDFERRTRLRFVVDIAPGLREPRGAAATALFRIYQEAVTNVLRHANASRVQVSLRSRGDRVLLRIRDDGVGIARDRLRNDRSLGLTGMRERAAVCGGRLFVVPLREGGTLVSAQLPLQAQDQDDGASAADRAMRRRA